MICQISALVELMTWCLRSDSLLPGPILTKVSEAIVVCRLFMVPDSFVIIVSGIGIILVVFSPVVLLDPTPAPGAGPVMSLMSHCDYAHTGFQRALVVFEHEAIHFWYCAIHWQEIAMLSWWIIDIVIICNDVVYKSRSTFCFPGWFEKQMW